MRRLAAATLALTLSACTAIIGDREQSAVVDASAAPDLAGADLIGTGILDFAGADLTGVLGLPSQPDSSLSVSPTSVPADGSSNGLITVLVRDSMGSAVVGQPVSLTATGTAGVITPTSGITNGLGVFNATITSTKAETKTVTATVFGFTLDGDVIFTAGSAVLGSSSLGASPTTITADDTTTTTLTVTVRDSHNNPVTGQNVTFSVDGSGNTLTPAGASTDANGQQTATLKTTKAEMKTVTATVGAFILTQGVTALAGLPDATLSTLSASPTSNLAANGSAGSTVTATLKDAQGNLVTGTSVMFAASGGGTSFSANNVATNGSGVATSTLSSTTTGAKNVTATAAGVLVTQSPTVTFSACTTPTALTSSPLAGDTTAGSNLYHPVCATQPDANERVYSFSIGASAQSAILDRGPSFAGAVTDIRPAVTGCSADAQSQVCTGDRYVYCPSLPANASYQVVVDGSTGAVGTFAIDVATAAAKGANSYGVVTTPPTFSSIVGLGTRVMTTAVTFDGTASSQLPFAFKFFGTTKPATTPLTIFQNGYIGFAATPNTRQNVCPMPSASLPAETIAPFWGRLGARNFGTTRGEVWILATGSAPNRTYTVEWSQMDAWQEPTGTPATYECVKMSIQAILYETSNLIEFRYLPVNEDTCGKNTTADVGYSVGGHSTIGIQGATSGVLVESASCNAADGIGPQVVGTIADAGVGFPDICTATKGYLFVPPTAGCP